MSETPLEAQLTGSHPIRPGSPTALGRLSVERRVVGFHAALWLTASLMTVGWTIALLTPDQFTRNEYYATYYRRTTLIDELVFLAHPAVGVTVTICVGRDATSQRRFSARVRDQLQAAAPVTIALANRH